MKFEERFPSLKGFSGTKNQIEDKDKCFESYLWGLTASCDGLIGSFPDYDAQEYVNTFHINKHCIDKQLVIDALNHWLLRWTGLRDAIKYELGLK